MLLDIKQCSKWLSNISLLLARIEGAWECTFQTSIFVTFWLSIKNIVSKTINQISIGSLLQILSYLIVLALTIAIGLPQFANDKEGLALFVIVALILRGIGSLLSGKEVCKTNLIDMLVLGYLGVYVISTFASHYFLPSIKGLFKDIVYIAGYFVFVAALNGSRKRTAYKRIISMLCFLVATGFLVALYGLYQYKIGVAPLATWEDPTVEIKATRIYSTLGNPNLLAGYLIPMFPISLALSMVALWSKKFWLFLPALIASAVLALAIVLTGSRGGYIGLAVSFISIVLVSGSWLWQDKPKLRPIIILSALILPFIVAAAMHFVPSFEQRALSIFAGREHTSNSFRLNVWQSSFKMFLDNWWIGIGPGNQTFRLAYGLYMVSGYDALGTYCVPLEIAVEAGIFALITFGAILLATLIRAHQDFWSRIASNDRWLILGLVSAIAGMMAHGLVDTVFYRPQVQFIFWLIMASLVTVHQYLSANNKIETKKSS